MRRGARPAGDNADGPLRAGTVPRARALRATPQTIRARDYTAVAFYAEAWDTHGMHDSAMGIKHIVDGAAEAGESEATLRRVRRRYAESNPSSARRSKRTS
jgi:hypothetical protein